MSKKRKICTIIDFEDDALFDPISVESLIILKAVAQRIHEWQQVLDDAKHNKHARIVVRHMIHLMNRIIELREHSPHVKTK